MTEQQADIVPEEGLSWFDLSWIMLSDVVGTSVLTLNGVAARLGFVLTVAFICGLFPVALYTSVLMSRTRRILTDSLGVTEPLGTMGQVAGATFRSAHVGRIVTLVVYGYTLLGQASYMLVLGNTLQQVFYSTSLCLPVAVLLSIAALLVPTFGLRRLRDSVALCFFNSMLILAVIVIALVRLGYNRPDCKHTYWFEPGVSLLTCLGAATNVVYSFSGQWMYFELMDTMAEPKDFPKAFLVSGPFMLTTYLSVALLGYWFGSGKMDLVGGMPHGPTLQVAAVLLFMHVVIVYLIKSVVLIRYAHGSCRPGQVEKRSCRSYLEHGGWGVGVLLFCFLVSNIILFFSQLLGIIGGFFAGPISFLFPITFFLVAKGREEDAEISTDSQEEEPLEGKEGSSSITSSGSSSADEEPRLRFAWQCLPVWERLLLLLTVVFILATMVFGVAEEIKQVIKLWGEFGAPFDCHTLREPKQPCMG